MYYDSALYLRTTWLGVPIQKNPFDLWVFQEILHETRPDILVETGTAHGGSALWFASMFDLLDRGRILTIDITETRVTAATSEDTLLAWIINGAGDG